MKKSIFVLSIAANIVFVLFFIGKRIYYSNRKPEKKVVIEEKRLPYWLNRQEYFKVLPNDSNEIVLAGDSHTQQFELAEMFKDLRIKNRGINGDNTRGLLNRLDEITESKPDKVFIEIGINDLLQDTTVEAATTNIKNIIKAIKQESPKTKVFFTISFPH